MSNDEETKDIQEDIKDIKRMVYKIDKNLAINNERQDTHRKEIDEIKEVQKKHEAHITIVNSVYKVIVTLGGAMWIIASTFFKDLFGR